MVDGGTTLRLNFDGLEASRKFQDFLAGACPYTTFAAQHGKGKWGVGAVSPEEGLEKIQRNLASLVARVEGRDDGMVRLPVRSGLAGGAVEDMWARVTPGISRHSGQAVFNIRVEGYIYLDICLEGGWARLELKKQGLWSLGAREMLEYWLAELSWWLIPSKMEGFESKKMGFASSTKRWSSRKKKSVKKKCSLAHRLGWYTTRAELCTDFMFLLFLAADLNRFVGFNSSGFINGGGEEVGVTDLMRVWAKNYAVETIQFGTRKSAVSLVAYNKTLQVQKCLGGDDSAYRSYWERGGWEEGDDLTRIEIRLTTNGLVIEDKEGKLLADLADPFGLADETVLNRIWVHTTGKRRLVLEPGADGRLDRAKVDPRWLGIRAAGTKNMSEEEQAVLLKARQRREVQQDAHKVKFKKAIGDAARSLGRVAAVADQIPVDDVITDKKDQKALLDEAFLLLREVFFDEHPIRQTFGKAQVEVYFKRMRTYSRIWRPHLGPEMKNLAKRWPESPSRPPSQPRLPVLEGDEAEAFRFIQ